jgi:hypothetical protein
VFSTAKTAERWRHINRENHHLSLMTSVLNQCNAYTHPISNQLKKGSFRRLVCKYWRKLVIRLKSALAPINTQNTLYPVLEQLPTNTFNN